MGKNIFKDSHVIAFIVFVLLVVAAFVYLRNFTSREYLVEKHAVQAQAMLERLDLQTATPGQIETVIERFEKAISMSPLSGRAGKLHFNIARLYVTQKQYDKAIAELETVGLNFSRNVALASEAQFQIGRICEVQNDWPAAVAAYEKIYEKYGLSQRGLYAPLYIAERYKMMGDTAKTEESYGKAFKQYEKLINELGNITQTAILINYLALTYGSQGDWNMAAEKWEELIATYPESPIVPPTLLMLGEVYADRLEAPEKAIALYDRVINDYPESKEAVQADYKLLQLYFFTGRYAETRELCLKIMDTQKDSPEVVSEATLLLARTYEKEGNWDEADKVYNRVVEEFPSSITALRVPIIKAKHYQGVGDTARSDRIYELALAEYKQVIADNPGTPLATDAQDLISLVYVTKEDWPGLIAHLNDLLNKVQGTPRHAQLLFLKGYITQSKIGDKDAARLLYEDFLTLYTDSHPLAPTVMNQIAALDEEPIVGQEVMQTDAEDSDVIESILPVTP